MSIGILKTALKKVAQNEFSKVIVEIVKGRNKDIYTFTNQGNKIKVQSYDELFNTSLGAGSVDEIIEDFKRPYKLWEIRSVRFI